MRRNKKIEPAFSMDEAEKQIADTSKVIDYFVSEYTIELLVNKLQKGDFKIPDYQREFTWDESRKCKFIESIFMGLPIPFIFFWENPETGKLEIVDGSQRLRTLLEFMNNGLTLNKLEKLNMLNGYKYKDLKESRQLKFGNRSIRGIILSESADLEARFDLFERINTGSLIAKPAEIRRAAFNGPFMDMIIELSEGELFKSLTPLSTKLVKEREREELIIRFFAYGDGLEEYADNVTPFINNYLNKMNSCFKKNEQNKSIYMERFNKTMNFIKDNFPYGFTRTQTGKAVPRARYEGIAIGTYLALAECEDEKNIIDNICKLLESKNFLAITKSDSANNTNKLKGRIYTARDILLGREINAVGK